MILYFYILFPINHVCNFILKYGLNVLRYSLSVIQDKIDIGKCLCICILAFPIIKTYFLVKFCEILNCKYRNSKKSNENGGCWPLSNHGNHDLRVFASSFCPFFIAFFLIYSPSKINSMQIYSLKHYIHIDI